jgi:repressor LexA
MTQPLQEVELQIIRAIQEFHFEHGYPPTRTEIAAMCGITTVTLWRRLKRLKAIGVIQDTGKLRGIKVVL